MTVVLQGCSSLFSFERKVEEDIQELNKPEKIIVTEIISVCDWVEPIKFNSNTIRTLYKNMDDEVEEDINSVISHNKNYNLYCKK